MFGGHNKSTRIYQWVDKEVGLEISQNGQSYMQQREVQKTCTDDTMFRALLTLLKDGTMTKH